MAVSIIAFYGRIDLTSLAFQEFLGISFYLMEVEVL